MQTPLPYHIIICIKPYDIALPNFKNGIFNYNLLKTKCIALPWPFFPFAIIIVKHEGIHFAILQLWL
jgi:hypothetical protein